jgi:hypothetical protein
MRYAVLIIFLILGIVIGIILPYFLQERIADVGITLPSSHGSTAPARTYQISDTAIFWFLRALGIGLGLIAVWFFALFRHDSET